MPPASSGAKVAAAPTTGEELLLQGRELRKQLFVFEH